VSTFATAAAAGAADDARMHDLRYRSPYNTVNETEKPDKQNK